MNEPQDNLVAAMNHEAEHMDLTIKPNTGSEPGNPATTQVLIRCTPNDRDRWKEAASRSGKSLSEFIRATLNSQASEILDCQHPVGQRRYYPWTEICLECGQGKRLGKAWE